jgi:hypothetical protein
MLVGEYVSPDGHLRLLVTCPDGDWTIGFDGFPWHTHGSILADLSGQDEVSAVEHFLADLTTNVSVIGVKRTSGKLTEVWVSDDPTENLADHQRFGEPNATLEFRFWDGTAVLV